jgi:hypothetical protein
MKFIPSAIRLVASENALSIIESRSVEGSLGPLGAVHRWGA